MDNLDLNKKRLICDCHVAIQGEGQYAGTPQFLIRFSGCNLNCFFADSICDTAYASWKPEGPKHNYQDVINLVNANPQVKFAFITGGEPTLNEQLLNDVIFILKERGIFVAIETNGTIFRNSDIDFVTISPKLSNSVPKPGVMLHDGIVNRMVTDEDRDKHEKGRTNYDAMKKWYDNFPTQFKFVISTGDEIPEILELQKIIGIVNEDIYLMPEGITNEQLQSKRELLFDLCIKYGFNYTDRLHIITYGNKRLA